MTDHRKAIVEHWYDAIGNHYLDWISRIAADPRDREEHANLFERVELLIDEVLDTMEPEDAVPFLWVLARKRPVPC